MIKVIASSFNVNVETTLTGFKFIGERAEINKGRTEYLFGCEESYGSLVKDFVRDKDAVQACFILAEIANFLASKEMTMIDYLEEIYQKYGYYYEYTKSITLLGLSGLERMNHIMDHFRDHPLIIPDKKLLSYDDLSKHRLNIKGQQVNKIRITNF
jgi:phosphoglucomutase